uniref:Uncharacterized protein n=1 Tax=Thermosporothrix sp. COM3 TaxID=2490863 RepID=A0A455SI72_9CHLR|nr:hypothetical protein KTC_13630 [Thermosporothrix sp. COM3]
MTLLHLLLVYVRVVMPPQVSLALLLALQAADRQASIWPWMPRLSLAPCFQTQNGLYRLYQQLRN